MLNQNYVIIVINVIFRLFWTGIFKICQPQQGPLMVEGGWAMEGRYILLV